MKMLLFQMTFSYSKHNFILKNITEQKSPTWIAYNETAKMSLPFPAKYSFYSKYFLHVD